MTAAPLLVTGGTGLLGLHWAAACRNDRPVSITTNRRQVRLDGTTALALDLANPAALDAALKATGAKVVVHAAGLTSVETCERDPDAAHQQNVLLAENVARATERAGARLIHISTDHLFDGRDDLYVEDSPPSPLNVYGLTKARAEEAVLRACPGALVLRTNFYGWGPGYRASFSDWVLSSLRAGRRIPLFSDMRYTPTHIAPLVAAAMDLSARGVTGILHAVGDDALSKHTFGLRLCAAFGLPPSLIEDARMADHAGLVLRPRSMALSGDRLRALMGRGLGCVDDHLALLRTEENSPAIKEIRAK